MFFGLLYKKQLPVFFLLNIRNFDTFSNVLIAQFLLGPPTLWRDFILTRYLTTSHATNLSIYMVYLGLEIEVINLVLWFAVIWEIWLHGNSLVLGMKL